MPKGVEKVKINVKERVKDDNCDLSLSELTEVPVREIASFKRVTILDLSSNRLDSLGSNFSTLKRLVRLDLSKNRIRELPEDFGELEYLRHLDLFDNCLEHLPLSFGQLSRLRYLDLKGNPLSHAWSKVVGRCLTLKDCQTAARNCVSICANLNPELVQRERLAQERQLSGLQMAGGGDASSSSTPNAQANGATNKKSGKANKKSKNKKASSSVDNELTIKPVNAVPKPVNQKIKHKNKSQNSKSWIALLTGPALSSLMTFLVLFIFNVILIYMIMFRKPDIADKLVEYIPQQYRDWILSKTEIFRLRVTDWISGFVTPPEEN